MALGPLLNRAYQTSSTTGIGDFSLTGSAPTGMNTFVSQAGDGGIAGYVAVSADGASVEVGYGVVTAGVPDTLSRTVIQSTNANAKVSFGAGGITIFSAPIRELLLQFNAPPSYANDQIAQVKTIGGALQWVVRTPAQLGADIDDGLGVKAVSYAWSTWNPSDVAGTETIGNNGVGNVSDVSSYLTAAMSGGTLTYTFTKPGSYLISNVMYGAAGGTSISGSTYLKLAIAGSATKFLSGPSTPNFFANFGAIGAYANGNITLPMTFLVKALASQTLTVAPYIAVNSSGGTASQWTASCMSTAAFFG